MKLYFIRHGESEDNLAVRHGGWSQAPLTEKGVNDAKGVRAFLECVPFDKVYTSDLLRTQQTAQNALPQYAYEQTPLLREIHVGSLQGKSIAQCKEMYGDAYKQAWSMLDFVQYGGENLTKLCARAAQFLEQVAQSEYACVAAFSHGGLIKAALSCVLQQPIQQSLLQCTNCTVMILEYADGKWEFSGWIQPHML